MNLPSFSKIERYFHYVWNETILLFTFKSPVCFQTPSPTLYRRNNYIFFTQFNVDYVDSSALPGMQSGATASGLVAAHTPLHYLWWSINELTPFAGGFSCVSPRETKRGREKCTWKAQVVKTMSIKRRFHSSDISRRDVQVTNDVPSRFTRIAQNSFEFKFLQIELNVSQISLIVCKIVASHCSLSITEIYITLVVFLF